MSVPIMPEISFVRNFGAKMNYLNGLQPEDTGILYKAIHVPTGISYIGQTFAKGGIKARWNQHYNNGKAFVVSEAEGVYKKFLNPPFLDMLLPATQPEEWAIEKVLDVTKENADIFENQAIFLYLDHNDRTSLLNRTINIVTDVSLEEYNQLCERYVMTNNVHQFKMMSMSTNPAAVAYFEKYSRTVVFKEFMTIRMANNKKQWEWFKGVIVPAFHAEELYRWIDYRGKILMEENKCEIEIKRLK
jgi:hypothetical protein